MSKLLQKIPKVVCLGGGNAMPKAVLEGIKKYPVRLSVICAVLDNGGSAGRERESYTKISFGDIRRAIFALSDLKPEDRDRYAVRIPEGPFAGYVVGNVLSSITVMATGSSEIAIERLVKDLKVPDRHQVLAPTFNENNADIVAELENGDIISGEKNIDVPKHDNKLRIKKIYLNRPAEANPKALDAIKDADLIVIGPGDLYSSLAQILLISGISEAINESSAKKIYICNLMTKKGETNGFSVLDFTNEIEKYLEGSLDFVIYNKEIPSKDILTNYREKHQNLDDLVVIDNSLNNNKKFIGADLLSLNQIEHDSDKLAKIIIRLCRQ